MCTSCRGPTGLHPSIHFWKLKFTVKYKNTVLFILMIMNDFNVDILQKDSILKSSQNHQIYLQIFIITLGYNYRKPLALIENIDSLLGYKNLYIAKGNAFLQKNRTLNRNSKENVHQLHRIEKKIKTSPSLSIHQETGLKQSPALQQK